MSILQELLDYGRLWDGVLAMLIKAQLLIFIVSPTEQKLLLTAHRSMSLNSQGGSIVARRADGDRVKVTSSYIDHFHI